MKEDLDMLKEREQKILDYMRKEIREKGYPPTVREICSALDIKSTSTAHKDIASLVSKGYIKKDPSKPRALMLVDNGQDPVHDKTSESVQKNIQNSVSQTEVVDIPVVGRIAAGTPILAEQNIENYFPIPMEFMPNNQTFMLKVKGESMINAGIFDGDLVLVEQCQTARNGEMVVALIEDGATVKTFYKEKAAIRLQPENDSMDPIIVTDVKILGKVIGVFRFLA